MKQPWKKTSPCYGFLLLGHWPQQLSAATYAQKKKKKTPQKNPHTFKRFKRCLGITLATMTDLQADNGVDCHQGFFPISVAQFCFDRERHLAQVAILDYCFARKFLNILSACHYACQHNVSALSVRNVPSVWPCDHLSSVACFNLSSQHCRLWLCSVLSLFSSPTEHVLSTINIGRLCAESHPLKLDSSLKRKWNGVQVEMLGNTDSITWPQVKPCRDGGT